MLRISNHHVSRITASLLLLEFSFSILAVYLGALIRLMGSNANIESLSNNFFQTALAFALCVVFSMSLFGMYHVNMRQRLTDVFLRLMPALSLALGSLGLIFFAAPTIYLGRGVMSIALAISAVLIMLTRFLVFKTSESGLLRSRVIFLGAGALAQECHQLAITNEAHHQYDIIGFVPVGPGEICVSQQYLLPDNESIFDLATKHRADEIVVSVQDRRGGLLPIDDLLDCKLHGIKVIDAGKFFEREAHQIRVEWLQPGWLTFGKGFDQSVIRKRVKQVFDLATSVIVLIFALPFMLLIALCIFIEDRGPIFYFQENIGLNGKKFTNIKFRSLSLDAEKWDSMSFPGTTHIGTIIRKFRLDELPQIFNVLKGEMSFVGPTPERTYYSDHLTEEVPFYAMRHSIKPGITGMAQVTRSFGASVEDSLKKLQYDLYYVKNNSLFLDILIMLRTVQVILIGKDPR
jgi:sugar transferase (PEP-CTERM system associated)